MSFSVAIKGKAADRFRAYGLVKLLRSPNAADIIKRHEAGLPVLAPGSKIRYAGEDVVLEGAVSGEALTVTAAPGQTITKVVFYQGAVESEAVVGSVEVNATGAIAIEIVEAPDVMPAAVGAQIVDE